MARTKIEIDWDKDITENPCVLSPGDNYYKGVMYENEPMLFAGEKEYQAHLVTYLADVFQKAGISPIHRLLTNHEISAQQRRIKCDIYIIHEDRTVTIIECKYSKDNSPGERLINQVKGMGQVLLYKEIHLIASGITPRIFLADEKPEDVMIRILKKQNIGFIAVKDNRLFLFNPY